MKIITEKLSLFSEHWSPKVVTRLNDYEVKVYRILAQLIDNTLTVLALRVGQRRDVY